MSHTMNITLSVTDREAVEAACQKTGARLLATSKAALYDGVEYEGLVVHLEDWNFPIIFGNDGLARYDNYKGKWGSEAELYKFVAHYGVEKAKIEARHNNIFGATETEDENFITLTLNVD